jgi:hypothetical protein
MQLFQRLRLTVLITPNQGPLSSCRGPPVEVKSGPCRNLPWKRVLSRGSALFFLYDGCFGKGQAGTELSAPGLPHRYA